MNFTLLCSVENEISSSILSEYDQTASVYIVCSQNYATATV